MADLSVDPHDLLAGVHPDLARVILTASQQPLAFRVVYGLRSSEEESACCASGHSQTMHSRHLASPDGLARAVDLGALAPDGTIFWAEGHEEQVYGQIAQQVLASAKLRGVPLQWGGAAVGAWEPGVPSHFRDWGHFQLPWASYHNNDEGSSLDEP